MRASSVRRAAATRAAIIPALARRMTAAPHHVAMAEAAGAGRRGASSLTAAAADARSASASASAQQQQRQNKNQPILLLDVMDTLVSDPFYEAMPRHFNMPFRDLLAQKHPTAWLEFERGEIAEDALLRKFFADGRVVDGAALVAMMRQHYRLLDGIEPLLDRLKASNVEMHACSNYPGLRKPQREAFSAVCAHLGVRPESCVLVDDREANVEAAREFGMRAVRFEGCASALERELRGHGLEF